MRVVNVVDASEWNPGGQVRAESRAVSVYGSGEELCAEKISKMPRIKFLDEGEWEGERDDEGIQCSEYGEYLSLDGWAKFEGDVEAAMDGFGEEDPGDCSRNWRGRPRYRDKMNGNLARRRERNLAACEGWAQRLACAPGIDALKSQIHPGDHVEMVHNDTQKVEFMWRAK
ncbi:hypothetical protein DFH09DRAFT_1087954 [Mycena vulgaris]|nr:hypothetical protein DFH09DRAFT_1087954 [Mycena vulgaris]